MRSWVILIEILALWVAGMVPAFGVDHSIQLLPVLAVILLIVQLVSAPIAR